MTISMYQASVPVFVEKLHNLSEVLRGVEKYAHDAKIDPIEIVNARWRAGAIPLYGQVHIICDTTRGCATKLANIKPAIYPLTDMTFPEFQERIAKSIAYLQAVDAKLIDGSEKRLIRLQNGTELEGQEYLLSFAIPKIYFHMSFLYATLRVCGVPIDKRDILGFNDE